MGPSSEKSRPSVEIVTEMEGNASNLNVTSAQNDSKNSLTLTATHDSNPFFIPSLSYTREEEARVVRILDTRLFPWILLTTFVLNMDRTNISNAISDNLPDDLGFTIDTVNAATAVYSVIFAIFCLSGAVVAKIFGPARWIPALMTFWGLVTLAHALVKERNGYFVVRSFIAITEGGVIPATLVYLGGFYKSTELATRLAWFWGVQTIASAVSGLMASGLLQLRGVGGLEGWKWLFIVDGIITEVIAVLTWFYLPRGINQTRGGIRGFKPWFTDRQVQIAVTRVIKDDISKKIYEKRVRWADFKDTLTDPYVWGHLFIAMISLTPTTPLQTYLPFVIKSFNFNVFVANALTAPPYVLQCIVMVIVIHHSDRTGERGYHGAFGSAWQMVGWILLRTLPKGTSKGVKYFSAVVVASWPYNHPLNIAWMSENTGSVGKRTISSGLIIGFANIYGVWASQIYRADDAPDFRRGNSINIAFGLAATILWFVQKFHYKYSNARNRRRFNALSDTQKREQEIFREGKGNRSLLFEFTT